MINKGNCVPIDPNTKQIQLAIDNLHWQVPAHFNMAQVVCDRHPDLPDRVVIVLPQRVETGITHRAIYKRQAVVIGKPDEPPGVVFKAFVITRDEQTASNIPENVLIIFINNILFIIVF